MHAVKKAKYVEEFKLLLTFEDKTHKLVDLFPHLYGEVFEPLQDPSYFKNFKVNEDTDTIEWENGADMSPDFLYRIGKEIKSLTLRNLNLTPLPRLHTRYSRPHVPLQA
jgi:hypothetical protein